MKAIKTYRPIHASLFSFQIERNISYANFVALTLEIPYLGELKQGEKLEVGEYLFSHESMSREESEAINLDQELFWGGINDFSVPLKCIIHPVYRSGGVEFGVSQEDFGSRLAKLNISIPGYTCFTEADLLSAYPLVEAGKYRVRLKYGIGSATSDQYRLDSVEHLKQILLKYSDDEIQKYGMLIERNLIGDDAKQRPKSYSAGFIEIGDVRFSYIAEVNIGDLGMYGYRGSRLRLYRGWSEGAIAQDPIYAELSEKVALLEPLIRAEKSLVVGSRLNLDWVVGKFEMLGEGDSEATLSQCYLTEIDTRPGGATAGELVGFEYFLDLDKPRVLIEPIIIDSVCEYAYYGFSDTEYDQLFCESVDPRLGGIKIAARVITK